MSYVSQTIQLLHEKYSDQAEFIQAAEEVLMTIEPIINSNPKYENSNILERIIIPERIIIFRIPWMDDNGKVIVNTGYRVQFNSAIGPYKGGLRFHPSVTLGTIKFLGFEQIFKNCLTGQSIGGGKGGSDFDPKGKSDNEVMRFCQSFMTELYRHIGRLTDVPAGDIGVGGREIGYLFGQYKRIVNAYEGVLTGKGLNYGGSLARKEATGFGLVYITEELLNQNKNSLNGKNITVSGSGNVAIYAAKKANQLGGKVVAMSDSSGYIYDEDGIDIDTIIDIKEIRRGRISEYVKIHPKAIYTPSRDIWSIKCDVALPCATQNELTLEDAKTLIKNGCIAICEGSNMSSTIGAVDYFIENKIMYIPGKAANAGGVGVSALEMSQNSQMTSWTFEEADTKLKEIMINIYNTISSTAKEFNQEGNLVAGANIAGFKKIADAMLEQGLV